MSRKKQSGGAVKAVLIALMVLMIAATGLLIYLCIHLTTQQAEPAKPVPTISLPELTEAPTPAPSEETQPVETQPQFLSPIATATIGSMGDILMHEPVIRHGKLSDGSFDFTYMFRYIKDYISAFDYAVANLETTLGGPGLPYQGQPTFNCPDAIVDAAVYAGYDMLLTGNNHCGDTKAEGVLRTLEQVRGKGLATLGTQMDKDEPKYAVVDVNGIKLGMLCYTYATGVTNDGRPVLNKNAALKKSGIVNFFRENDLPTFYKEVQTHLDNMKADGAEATILYIHWGKEYQLEQNDVQTAMAQKLCDMGVDVIVGGHPHVVEPMDLLTSTVDPDHKTVVLYSMGNAVANQRKERMDMDTGHTEDGLLFSLTFDKYPDGSVYLSDTDVLPTWTQLTWPEPNDAEFNILPADMSRREEWGDLFGWDESVQEELEASYERTMAIVGEGLQKCKMQLSHDKHQREGLR